MCRIKATIQAIPIWKTTILSISFLPASLEYALHAAIHGVYSKQNTRYVKADAAEMEVCKASVLPYNIVNMETTLSFAINPEISAVTSFQLSKPSGANKGVKRPARYARML